MYQQALPDADARRTVAELAIGERVDSVFLLCRCSQRTTKAGAPYLALEIGDRSGRLEGRQWDGVEETVAAVKEGDYVRVVGAIESWNGNPQLKVESMEPAAQDGIDPAEFLPASTRDTGEMYDELLGIIAGIENPHLQALLQTTFGDPEVADLFRRAPAGVMLHHAYVGGLLEHTLSVVHLARRVADHYDSVDNDLVITGACLHDLGKIWELAYDNAFDYTDEGRLVGHLLLESNWLAARIDGIDGFPRTLRNHVLHLLASHHGRPEHGAPVSPITREALVLHYVDDLDSKMGAMDMAIAEAEASGADAAYSRSLGRRIVRRQWNEVEE